MENNNIYLIYKYLRKELTSEEAKKFKHLCENDKDFEKKASEIILSSLTIESLLELASEKKVLLQTKKNIKLKHTNIYFIAAAACVLIFVILKIFFLNYQNKKNIEFCRSVKKVEMEIINNKNVYKNKYNKFIIDDSLENFQNFDKAKNEQLIASIDLSIIYIERSSNDCVTFYLQNKQYEKAISLELKNNNSKCIQNIEIGRIALIAAQK